MSAVGHPVSRRPSLPMWLLIAALVTLAVAGNSRADDVGDGYAEMLGYLAQTRIDGEALARSRGAIAVNMASGDHNQQANLRAIAIGANAFADVAVRQDSRDDLYDAPLHASASIGGSALAGAGGIASINQASGGGNAEFNAVTLVLAEQGIRETPDSLLSSSVSASAERQSVPDLAGRTASRKVAVEATALRGFEGVLQLNQIAGSANETGNVLSLSVGPGP